MAVTPTGAPAWVRLSDHTTYGGNTNKTNYQSQGAVNPRTDVTAEQFSRLVADLEALVRVGSFAVITFTCNDTVPAAPTVDDYDSMAGTAPTGARVSSGVVTFTWDASYLDPYGVSGDIHIAHAIVTGTSASQVGTVVLSDPDVNSKNERATVTIEENGAPIADASATLVVWTSVA